MNEPAISWHTCSTEAVAARLGVAPLQGLSAAEAVRRMALHGPNRLAEPPPKPLWLKFLNQFRNVLILLLLAAAVVTAVIGHVNDAIAIICVVVLNASLGFWQEHRAERTLAALKGMLAARARVRRDGRQQEVDAATLVPGDVVLLEAGDRVPADGRLLVARNLEADEAALTGESLAVAKHADALETMELPLGERANLLYMNTVVTRGRAELLVTATGMATEIGKLAGMIATAPEAVTPLQAQLDVLGKRLAAMAGVIVAGLFVLDAVRGLPLAEAAMSAVALAVASIPEGLPAVVTVTLALGMWRMAKSHAILKTLSAVETLGSTTVICSDKTGTLTLNQMTARRVWCAGQGLVVSGEGYRAEGAITAADGQGVPHDALHAMLLPLALCSDSRVHDGQLVGDPTEGALLVLAAKGGVDAAAEQMRQPRIAELPFDSAHKFMATFHHAGTSVEMFIKGAPDVVLGRSSHWLTPSGEQALDEATRAQCHAENERLAGQALRVLAVARRMIPAADFYPAGDLRRWTDSWTFLGLAGLMDPPRAEAKAAIAECRTAGVQVKMITGDHRVTAAAIATELGLVGETVDGMALDGLDDDALAQRVEQVAVFARVSPQHKVRIVRALKARGHVVAMTGDGVNDAPALKVADMGVAMGINGTAVTREAARMVLADDNFATIVHAVKEGRVVYDNIVKFVRFQLSTNIGALLTVLAAAMMGWPAPFSAIHLLWINIIMDGPPAMTLGIEPGRVGLMAEPPRQRDTQILDGSRLLRLIIYGLTMMVGTLVMFQHGLSAHGPDYALTLAFTTFVLFQFFNVFNARAEYGSAFNGQFSANRFLWLALSLVLLLQIVAVHWSPVQSVFHTVDLTYRDWLLAMATASSVLVLDEGRKLGYRLLERRG